MSSFSRGGGGVGLLACVDPLESVDLPPANQEWNSAKDPKAAINQPPGDGNSAYLPGDERQGNDARAGDETEGDYPLIADWIAIGAYEHNGDDEMSKRQPVGPIRKKGVLPVGVAECVIHPSDPGKQVGVLGGRSHRAEL